MSALTKIRFTALALSAAAALAACQHTPPASAAETLSGRYVSEGYAQRAQGYDWVMVTVAEKSANTLNIDISARSDIKKPSGSFSGEAVKAAPNRYEVNDDGAILVFSFSGNRLNISSDSQVALHYHCSGGGSLADTYQKL